MGAAAHDPRMIKEKAVMKREWWRRRAVLPSQAPPHPTDARTDLVFSDWAPGSLRHRAA
jgi:hypothetical protein